MNRTDLSKKSHIPRLTQQETVELLPVSSRSRDALDEPSGAPLPCPRRRAPWSGRTSPSRTAAGGRYDGQRQLPAYATSNASGVCSHVGSRAGAAVRGSEGKFR